MTYWCRICDKKYDTKDEREACEKSHRAKKFYDVAGDYITCYDIRSFDDYVKILESKIFPPKDEFICRDISYKDGYAILYERINEKHNPKDVWLYLKPKGKRVKKNN